MSTHTETLETSAAPDTTVDAASVFGIKTKMKVPAFKTANEHVSIAEAVNRLKLVPPNGELVQTARAVDISFGD